MRLPDVLIDALSTLTANRLRTGLAVLGIIIGIGSVIALVSLGQGSKQAIESQIQSLGANLLTVSPSGQNTGAVRSAVGTGTSLTLADAEALQTSAEVTRIAAVSPELSERAQVVAGKNNTNTQIIGVRPEYATVHKLEMGAGVFISHIDDNTVQRVVVLGPQVATDLFGESDPIGQTVKINSQVLRVIGVTVSKGGSGFSNPDDMAYVPLATAQKQLFGTANLSSIALEAISQSEMLAAQNEVGYLLLKRHKLSDPTQADFVIFSQQDILSTASSVTGTFTALLSGIAGISLLVGGIGIMNIMLVTVTERTREIGLRKALGAKKKTIVTQFLVEATLLTIMGGTIGMILGIATSFVLAKLLNLSFIVDPGSIALAIGVSGGIGILFGWYPAKTAANLQPIEALRYE